MNKADFQPILSGERVTLRPIHDGDWEGMFAVASNPKVWADHVKRDRYKEDIFRPFFESALSSGSALTIICNKTQKIIGTSRYHEYKPDLSEIEIGWTFIAHEYWGGGYNAEAKFLMLNHIFKVLDVVVFWVAQENIRSQKAMEKIGSVLRDGQYSKIDNGEEIPYVIFEIRKKDFPAGLLRRIRPTSLIGENL